MRIRTSTSRPKKFALRNQLFNHFVIERASWIFACSIVEHVQAYSCLPLWLFCLFFYLRRGGRFYLMQLKCDRSWLLQSFPDNRNSLINFAFAKGWVSIVQSVNNSFELELCLMCAPFHHFETVVLGLVLAEDLLLTEFAKCLRILALIYKMLHNKILIISEQLSTTPNARLLSKTYLSMVCHFSVCYVDTRTGEAFHFLSNKSHGLFRLNLNWQKLHGSAFLIGTSVRNRLNPLSAAWLTNKSQTSFAFNWTHNYVLTNQTLEIRVSLWHEIEVSREIFLKQILIGRIWKEYFQVLGLLFEVSYCWIVKKGGLIRLCYLFLYRFRFLHKWNIHKLSPAKILFH